MAAFSFSVRLRKLSNSAIWRCTRSVSSSICVSFLSFFFLKKPFFGASSVSDASDASRGFLCRIGIRSLCRLLLHSFICDLRLLLLRGCCLIRVSAEPLRFCFLPPDRSTFPGSACRTALFFLKYFIELRHQGLQRTDYLFVIHPLRPDDSDRCHTCLPPTHRSLSRHCSPASRLPGTPRRCKPVFRSAPAPS